MATLRRGLIWLMLVSMPLVATVNTGFAQRSGNAAPAPSNSQVVGRSYYVEGSVVVVLIGGALFAICRSSRRV